MNKFIKRPLALFLVVILLVSSAMANVPTYAIGRWPSLVEVPTVPYDVVEGVQYDSGGVDEIVNILNLGSHPGGKVLIKQEEYSIDWFWFPTDFWWIIPIEWSEFGNVSIDGDPYVELLSTVALPANGSPYSLVVIEDGVDGHCSLDDVITKVQLEVKVNEAPDAVDDSDTVDEGGSVAVDVVSNDDSNDQISLVQLFDQGTTTTYTGTDFVISGQTIIYTAPDEVAADFDVSVDYQIADHNYRNSKTDTATLTISVKAVNDPPEFEVLELATNTNTPVEFDPLVGVTDVDSTSISYTGFSDPAGGSVTDNTGTLTYLPDPGFVDAVDTFTVDIYDGEMTVQRTVNVSVSGVYVDGDVEARPDEVFIEEDENIDVDVTANDTFDDGFGYLVIESAEAKLYATVDDRLIKIRPWSTLTGTYYIEYTVYDNDASDKEHDSSTLTIHIAEDNKDLILRSDSVKVWEGTTKKFNVLSNDSIPKKETIKSIVISKQASWGSATVALDGTVTYVAHETYDGPRDDNNPDDFFEYQVELFSGEIDTEDVEIILKENDYLKLQDDQIRVNEDADWTYINVLDNDIIPENILDFTVDGPFDALHGTARRTGNGIEYKPDEGFFGIDLFSYKVRDADGTRDTANVEVIVERDPYSPIVAEDDLEMMYISSYSTMIDVLDNDMIGELPVTVETHEEDGDLIAPEHGTVQVNPDGSITYMPNSSYVGLDVFEYRIYDDVSSDVAFVLVDIRNDDPSVFDLRKKSLTVREGEFARIDLLHRTGIDMSLIDDFEIDSSPAFGMASVDLQGNLMYHAEDTFDNEGFLWWRTPLYMRYKITMQNNDIYYGCVKIYVNETDKLLLTDDVRTVLENSTDNFIPVQDNDIIDEGVMFFGHFVWDADDGPFHGSVTKSGNGFKYTPYPGYVGIDSFRYFVTDEDMDLWFLGDVADVIINVEAVETDDYWLEPEENFYIYPKLTQFKSINVTEQDFPEYFDEATLEVVNVEFAEGFGEENGTKSGLGQMVGYTPSTTLPVTLVYTLRDQYNHIAKGYVYVVVITDNSTDYIQVNDFEPVRVNQYSDPETNGMRSGVLYHTTSGEDPVFKYESASLEPNMYPLGFYEDNVKDVNGKNISITYYYGEFMVKYMMEAEAGTPVSALVPPLRPISVNGQPLISTGMDLNPQEVSLPEDAIRLLDNEEFDLIANYMSFDVLSKLYGFDFEDYNHTSDYPVSGNLLDNPTDLQVKFRLPTGEDEFVEFDISDFWNVIVVGNIAEMMEPLGSTMTGSEEIDGQEIDYTIYDVQFAMTDAEGFQSEWTDIWNIKIMNTRPMIHGVTSPLIVTVDDVLMPLDGVTVEDPEDTFLAGLGYVTLPLVDSLQVDVYDEILDEYVDLETTPINDLGPGVYRIEYSYEDYHGAMAHEETLMVILENPLVDLTPQTVEMETGGWFPVYNGVGYDESELVNLLNQSGLDYDLDLYFSAYVEEEGQLRELNDLEWVDESIVIIYKLDINLVYDIQVTAMSGPPNKPPSNDVEYDYELRYLRTINAANSDMGQVIYITDFWRDPEMVDVPVVGQMTSESHYVRHDAFALLMKLNPVTGQRRLVTAVYMETEYNPEPSDLSLSKECDFDDIAVSKTGDIYGIKSRYIMKLNKETMIFETIIDTKEEIIDFALRNELTLENKSEDCSDYQSLTIDDRGYLVLAVEDTLENLFMSSENMNYGDYDTALLFFNPQGFMIKPDLPLPSPTDPVSLEDDDEMFYLENVALVDWGMYDLEYTRETFDGFTDLAFNDDDTMLYGIGSYEDDPSTFYGEDVTEKPVDEGSIEAESTKSRDGRKYYQIFSLEEEMDLTPSSLETDAFFRYYKLSQVDDLEFGYMYRGMAVVGNDILVTRYMPKCLFDMVYNLGGESLNPQVVETNQMQLMKTEVARFTYNDGFVDMLDVMPVDGMFNAALGAAGMETTMTLSPSNVNIILYNDELATSKTAAFTLTHMPMESYVDVDWQVYDTNATELTGDGTGNFTLTSLVNSSRTLRFEVKAFNLVSGSWEMITGSVTVDYRIRPTNDPDPEPAPTPAPAAQAGPVIAVSLDTDAITLDYGETADPNFTSFDFTETVTGTSNTAVTWSLSDDTFVSVDANGLVTANDNIPVDTGDITVTLTVTTVDGGATATATILFEEQTPLGAIEFFEPYVSGYSDGMFRPSNAVTRAEVASMFARILRLRTTTLGTQQFADVSKDHWAYGSIQAMYTTGLFSGYLDSDGNRYFDPGAPISRSEIAQVISNYWSFLSISVTDVNTRPIPDVSSSYWASSAINKIFNTGIFSGFDDGTFRPDEPTLRGQIVSMINRLIARPANEAGTGMFSDILPTDEFFGDIEAASQTFLKPQGN